MLMVIFGAGASFDSSHFHSNNGVNLEGMPLAKDLFMDRPVFRRKMQDFPEITDIVPLLHNPNSSVEEILEDLMKDINTSPRRVRQMLALRYYLQAIIFEAQRIWEPKLQGVSNYKALVGLIEDWAERNGKTSEKAIFVTFNYDTLLDNVLIDAFDFQLQGLDDYVTGNNYKLFKVHGSINWGRELDRDYPSQRDVIKLANLSQISNQYYLLQANPRSLSFIDFGIRHAGQHSVIPAIAVPITSKYEFEAPQQHMDTLRKVLPQVDKVLTIGWAGIEKHFLAILKDCLSNETKFLCISGTQSQSEKTREHLLAGGVGQRDNYEVSSSTFTAFIQYHEFNRFLV